MTNFEHSATEHAWLSPAWRDYLVGIGAAEQDGATTYVSGAPDQLKGAVEALAQIKAVVDNNGVLLSARLSAIRGLVNRALLDAAGGR